MAVVTMTYGGNSISPVPLVTIAKNKDRSGDLTDIGSTFKITLNGTIINQNPGGLAVTDAALDSIKNIFKTDGQVFEIYCDATLILRCYPIVVAGPVFDESSDNWVFRIPYTIELEYYQDDKNEDAYSEYISALDESWNIEFIDDKEHYSWTLPTVGLDKNPYFLRLTHNISATGKRRFVSSGLYQPAWKNARDAVVSRLGYDNTKLGDYVININPSGSGFGAYNHVRTNQIGESDGSYTVTESWVLANSGTGIAGKAIEDFTINYRKAIETGINTITIDGSIEGLDTRSYGTNPGDYGFSQTKYAAAEAYWASVKTKLYYRCQYAASGETPGTLNIIPKTNSIGYNPTAGTITYAYEYDTRPSNCISGALSEVFTITDNNPTDVFASLSVIGRAAGPILQDMGTVTARTREVNIEVVMTPATGCPTTTGNWYSLRYTQSPKPQVDSLVQIIYSEMTGTYGQVFKHIDSENWNPKDGRYTRNVGYTAGNCS